MHLDKRTDEPELTEVVCVRRRDSWSVCVCLIYLVAACVCVSYKCLFVYMCVNVSASSSIYLCMCIHFCVCVCVCAVVMVQSGRSILKTLSGRIDFLFPDPWKRSCNTADPPSCVTLSFCDTDQSEDELEIAAQRPWTLRRRQEWQEL